MLLLCEFRPALLSLASQNIFSFCAEVASIPHEVSEEMLDNFQGWTISRILVRSKEPPGLLSDDREDHVCFSPAPTCVSACGFIPYLQRKR